MHLAAGHWGPGECVEELEFAAGTSSWEEKSAGFAEVVEWVAGAFGRVAEAADH